MYREKLGGFPIEVEKNGKTIKLRFYPKNPKAKYPDSPVLVLQLNEDDREKILKIFEQ